MKSIFEFSDYREFLQWYYHFHKSTVPGFSHRSFLSKAGLKGPNFLKNVMDGKKNLSPASTTKFSKALGLNKRESQYFSVLVQFNQAKTGIKKKRYFNTLSGFHKKSSVQALRKNQYEYFEKWYNVVIREYIHAHTFSGDYQKLAKEICPNITARQAESSVKTLLQLKMIRKNELGVFEITSPIITTGPEVSDIGAREYHKNMMEVAKKSLDTFTSEQRYIRGITSSFSEDTFHKAKMVIDQARKSLLNLIEQDQGSRKVYQVNLQLFPLFSIPKRKRKQK